MFEKLVIVDGKGHLLGRLASYCAKELQLGQRITVVRCDKLIISGSLFRNKTKFSEFLRKKMNHNPRRGTKHNRAPSRVFWRAVRGMLNHKRPKGAAALGKLKVFDGCPTPYDTRKKVVVPDALKLVRMRNNRDFCVLGKLCSQMGWGKQNLIDKLEEKRAERGLTYIARKLAKKHVKENALKSDKVKPILAELAKFGY